MRCWCVHVLGNSCTNKTTKAPNLRFLHYSIQRIKVGQITDRLIGVLQQVSYHLFKQGKCHRKLIRSLSNTKRMGPEIHMPTSNPSISLYNIYVNVCATSQLMLSPNACYSTQLFMVFKAIKKKRINQLYFSHATKMCLN